MDSPPPFKNQNVQLVAELGESMKVLYQLPSAATIYAGRTIYHGYKNAFIDLGHEFYTMTADDDSRQVLETFQPYIFITSLSSYYLKFLDIDAVRARKQVGMRDVPHII